MRLRRVGFPIWLRLSSNAGTYTALYSLDGASYTAIGTATPSFAGSVQIGLLFSSGDANLLGTGSFTNVSVAPSN